MRSLLGTPDKIIFSYNSTERRLDVDSLSVGRQGIVTVQVEAGTPNRGGEKCIVSAAT